MSRTIDCFLIEPTDRYQVRLRRFRMKDGAPCPKNGWCHNADVFVGIVQTAEDPTNGDDDVKYPHSDQRWPTKCDNCEYVFEDHDAWQVNYDQLYRAADGKEYTLLGVDRMTSHRENFAPVGAMWRATWREPSAATDGHSYVVRTPGGDWHIDGGAGDGTRWQRTGVAPKLTARPSILIGKDASGAWVYHGWLTDGQLIEC